MKEKIAIVNQRYGLEVNGGSEYYTRQLAEHLTAQYEVEVLTTQALDYDTWENYYPDDVEIIRGVTVRRFEVKGKRRALAMSFWGRMQKYCPFFRKYSGARWIAAQGPVAPMLIQYIKDHKDEYQIIFFVTCLYYPAVNGIKIAAEKSILLPTAHDEPYIYYPVYHDAFMKPKALIYLTPEEKKFVESHFNVSQKPNCVCGSGVDIPETVDSGYFREKYGIEGDYLIYAGRIDESKGCSEMFHIFKAYREQNPDVEIRLVLLGKRVMEIPDDENILSLGFVPEQDKFDGISGAKALWLPSRYESLSLAVLEAMGLGTPVIVNGRCEVLKGHCDRSGAGLYYLDERQALEDLKSLMDMENYDRMSENAKAYVRENYRWDIAAKRIDELLMQIIIS